jgi:opine dehydrogenase
VPACPLLDWLASAYGYRAATLRDTLTGNPAYAGIKAPATLEHRYLLEDGPTGLVPLVALGGAAGLHLPVLRGLVERAKAALGGEAWRRPRTLAALGLAGMGASAIRSFIEGHSAPTTWGGSPAPVGRVGLELVPQV